MVVENYDNITRVRLTHDNVLLFDWNFSNEKV